MKTITKMILAATVTLSAAPASAATLVDTGPQTSGGFGVLLSTTQYISGRFTLTAASVLTDVLGYIGSTSASSIRVAVRASNGTTPGATLFSENFTTSNLSSGSWQGVSGQNWAVAAGTYWISFETLTAASYMPDNAPNPLAATAFSQNLGATWTSVPIAFGLRVSGNVGAVPETATWGMMIAGFGMIGGAARYRRRSAKLAYARA